MTDTTVEHFFVYGTLAPGRPNEHVLADVAGTWHPATVRGTLRELGWGAAQGFPGIVLDDGAGHDLDGDDPSEVEGLVFSSPDLGRHWARLDEFEGSEYERVTVVARLEDGRKVAAQIYALRA